MRRKEGRGTEGNPSVRRGGQLPLHRGAEDNTPQFAVGDLLSPYTGESGVGGFGKDGVAFRDKGAANFRGRGERAEAEERLQRLGQMVVRDQ